LGTTFSPARSVPWPRTPAEKPPAAAAATSNKPETVEQRITTLKASLKITADRKPNGHRRHGDA
jgi:hypothetical protein